MSQTNTNTVGGNTNRNQNAARGGQGRVGSGGQGRGGRISSCISGRINGRGNSSIAKYSFEGKMKNGYLSQLTITESSNRAIQFKKIVDALLVYCTDQGYRYIANIICKNTELLESAFLPPYPDESRWSTTFHIEIETVNPASVPGTNGLCTAIKEMVKKTQVFNSNLQKQLLAEYEQKSRIKSQEWSKHIADKKSLITLLF